MLVTIVVAEVAGVMTLYCMVKKARLPAGAERVG